MSKSSRRVVRDIIISVALIGLLVLVYYYTRTPHTNLGQDIHMNTGTPPQQGMPPQGMGTENQMSGHGEGILPEEGDQVVAVALGHDITNREVNQEANRIFRKMGVDPTAAMAQSPEFKSLMRFQGLGEILSMLVVMERAPELGIDGEKMIDDALDEWSEGYGSPEERLAAVGEVRGVTVDRMRGMYFRELVLPKVVEELTKDSGDKTEEEKKQILTDWIIDGLKNLKVEFHDDDLAKGWDEYISGFRNTETGEPATPEPKDGS